MGIIKEFIGVRGETVGCDKQGNPFYNMHLTDTEIIRCRDCKHSRKSGERCEHLASEWEDAWVDPNGFCAWGKRRES